MTDPTTGISPFGETAPAGARVTLTGLATAANDSHRAATDTARSALRHALDAGRSLLEAKERIPHGSWTDWIEERCEFSPRTAQAYMRLARHWPELEPKAQSSAGLSIEGAMKLLAEADAPSRFDELSAKVQAARGALRAVELPPGWGFRGRAGPWWAVVRPSERPGLFYVASGFDRPDGSALVEETPEPVPLEEAPFLLVARETPEPFPFGRVAWDPFAFEGQAPAGPSMEAEEVAP